MATFEDPIEEEIEFEEPELEEEQQVEAQAEEPAQEEEVPEKYRGKSVLDVIKMHQELEKLNGRQAQEVGDLRKLADDFLKREVSQKQAVEQPKETKEDYAQRLYEDPYSVVSETVEKHPAIAEARQQAESYKHQQAVNKLKANFPDYEEILADTEFVEWVKASPIRLRLMNEADSNYDYDSAAEIFSTWRAVKPKPQETSSIAEESKIERSKNLKAATVDTGTSAPSSRKTYRRADLINLRLRDPARYEAMQDEIMAAYAEGRVK